ncbi:MAG: helix-turn-helix transcriptional regulator [Planctomycetota bacterium]
MPHTGWLALQVEIRSLPRDGVITSESVSHLLCRFFDLMPGGTEKRAGATCLRNGSPRRVARLAQEYIEDHYAGPIRMEDLCRSTGVSLRTLQRSFSKYFQVSPLQYIKARRPNAARQALVTGDAARDSVSQIALDNGFTHFGRFSADYRIHFSESPRATLARKSPGASCRMSSTRWKRQSALAGNLPGEDGARQD